jgi:hypothetical protein
MATLTLSKGESTLSLLQSGDQRTKKVTFTYYCQLIKTLEAPNYFEDTRQDSVACAINPFTTVLKVSTYMSLPMFVDKCRLVTQLCLLFW